MDDQKPAKINLDASENDKLKFSISSQEISSLELFLFGKKRCIVEQLLKNNEKIARIIN